VREIRKLQDHNVGLVDQQFLAWWDQLPESDSSESRRSSFQAYVEDWLETFKRIRKELAKQDRKNKIPEGQVVGRAAGALKAQFRMHPDIATLVSEVYDYSALYTPIPPEERWHGFAQPAMLGRAAIAWVNTPWADNS